MEGDDGERVASLFCPKNGEENSVSESKVQTKL